MLSRATPLLKVLVPVLTIALVVLLAAFARLLIAGTQPEAPRTEMERAAFAAEEAVRANPEDPASRIKLAASYLERKNYAAAVDQGKIAIRLAPDEPAGYYVLGLAEAEAGDPKSAVEHLTKAVETKGQLAQFYQDAYVALSRAQEKSGDMEGAMKSMALALSNGPENAILLYEQGQLYERNQKWVEALENYGWAMEYAPDMQEIEQAFTRLSAAQPQALKDLQERYSEEAPEEGAPEGEAPEGEEATTTTQPQN
jgi:tetratricopeptide (TPR) repeat protein